MRKTRAQISPLTTIRLTTQVLGRMISSSLLSLDYLPPLTVDEACPKECLKLGEMDLRS